MDKANDVGTLMEVRDWIFSNYFMTEEDKNIRLVVRSIIADITDTIDDILNEMYLDDVKVGLDD